MTDTEIQKTDIEIANDKIKELEAVIKSHKEDIGALKNRVGQYEKDPEKRAYFSLVRIVNMQVDYLNEFDIKANIGGKASEDAKFARTQGIWENLPKMISSLNELKIVLKITKADEESENKKSMMYISPESIADSINESAGQKS